MKKVRLFPEKYGHLPLFWSLYFLFPLYNLLTWGGWEGVAGIALLVLFYFFFRDIYWAPSRAFMNGIFMTIIVGIFLYFYHESFLYLAIYTAYATPFIQKRRSFFVYYVLSIMLFVELYWIHQSGHMVVEIAPISAACIMIVVIPLIMQYEIKWSQTKEKLDQANERIEELVKQQERERIGRDLHDTVGQTLSMITLKSDIALRMLSTNPAQSESEIKDIHQISRTVLNQIREIVTDLKQLSMEEEIVLSEKLLREASITPVVERSGSVEGLNPLYENILAFSLRECVTNVIRHSQATRCHITIEDHKKEIRLKVQDNGIGIQKPKGNGLFGMEERLRMISGRVSIENAANQGGSVHVFVPKVQRSKEKDAWDEEETG
ncbi:sensor histidine kinase [Halobacillus litoralis]|uniref:sensor histidine kinase n=1 Tax=Halobacillus litoralis TaxID=45668 RepID=UPI001CD80790|nr:sensor histidine kinase [Halobacillus litoralis]MCA0972329.1 sensor histidine kinase [Halobacillus litoralis]